MKIFSFLIAFLICSLVSAQVNVDSMRLQYTQKTMKLAQGVTMNGLMLSKTEVKNLMLISPEATYSYKLYLKNNKTGTILPFIGLAAVVGGLIISQDNRTPGYIMIVSGNVINIVAAVFRKIGGAHLQHAIWTYNRDILYPAK